MPILHPRAAVLQRFADHAAGPAETGRIARHLEVCGRCREHVVFARDIRAQVRGLPPLEASDETLARILASRSANVRGILPVDDTPAAPRHPVMRAVTLAAGLVFIAGLAVALQRDRLAGRPSGGPDDAELSTITSLFVATGVFPATAEARSVPRSPTAPVRGRRLEPMSLEFRRQWVREAGGPAVTAQAGRLAVRVSRSASLDSAWLVEHTWTGLDGGPDVDNARTHAESLYLTSARLDPISRVVHVTPYRRFPGISIRQRFSGDSVLGEMSLTRMPTRRPIARDLRTSRERLVASEALGPLYLMGVALSPGWHADLDLLGWAVVPGDVTYPFSMRVVGSERVTVPAGSFECWKLAITLHGETHWSWLRKSDRVGVRSRHMTRDARGMREIVLVRESRPSSPPPEKR